MPLLLYLALVAGSFVVKALPAAGLGLYVVRKDRLLAAALFASAAGDTVLGFKGYFVAGLVCFLVAHLLYAANFARRLRPRRGRIAISFALAAAIAALAAFIVPRAGALALPVAAYVVVISAMGVLAILADASALLPLGATFFVISDSLLALNRFVLPNRYLAIAILPAYFAAQYLIAAGWLSAHREARGSATAASSSVPAKSVVSPM